MEEEKPLLLIRADATSRMGTGHIMRCLALGREWRARGGRVVFMTHCESEDLRTQIAAAGMERVDVKETGTSQSLVSTLRKSRRAFTPVCILLDGYHFDSEYQTALRSTGIPLVVLDDLAHLSRYDADMILNQNIYARQLAYPCAPETVMLLGAKYALLRPEFQQWRDWQRQVAPRAVHLLITMGGSDADNVTARVLDALAFCKETTFQVEIVVGPGNTHLPALEQRLALLRTQSKALRHGTNALQRQEPNTRHSISIVVNPPNMAQFMAWADVAISAGGSTCLELAYMQVPTLALVLADNQRPVAASLEAAGTLCNLGWHNALALKDIACALEQLATDAPTRQSMAQRGRELVDGDGAARTVDYLWGRLC